jgi:hypothetical protein
MLALPLEVLKQELIPCHMTVLFCKPGEKRVQTAVRGTKLKKAWELRGSNLMKLTTFITSTHS